MGEAYATAFKLLTLGFNVIPSGGGGKHKAPLVNWRDYQTTAPDESQLQAWECELNPVLWGIVTNDRVAVIDADTPDTRAALEAELGEPHVVTPRGGAHWYIDTAKHPMKTVAGLLPGIDVRAVGGFVNVTGTRLAYTDKGVEYPTADYTINKLPAPGDTLIPWAKLPKRILAALNGSKPVARARQGAVIPDGQRNATLAKIAGAMRRQGADQAAIEAALMAIKCETPLPEREIKAIAASVSRYEPKPDTDHKHVYILTDAKGKQSLDLEALVNDLLSDFHFATLRDNDEILIYQDGYYQPQGGRFIKAECQRRVGVSSLLTEHKVNEITGHIIRSTYVERRVFNASKFALNLLNGILDTRTRVLRPHTPDHFSTIRIPIVYDGTANCPAIRKFFSEVHHSKDIPVVEEIMGDCLTPDNSFQKAVLNVGGGDQGKSTELSLLKAFLGADNVSNVPWHALELNRFAMSALEGKLANIFADLPSHSLNVTSAFKMLTGGDTIGTEKKFGDYFSFVNHAKLIFSANKPPKVLDEDSYAFWRRWIILDFPNQIPEDKKDVNILDKLTTPAELSGLLNIALDGLARLRAAGRFSYDKSVEDTTEYYLRAADTVYAFLQDCVEMSPTDWVTKDDLYQAFQAYCVKLCLPVSKPNSFARSLQNQAGYRISSTRPEVDGKRVTAWQGIKISVKDVKDVKVFSLSKGHARGNNNTQIGIKIEKNAGNLDAIASITHDPPNPDADYLPGYPSCEFTPPEDRQEVPPDADAPPGLEIRTDLTSGKNFGRKLPPKVDYAAALGMTVEDALELWQSAGAPIIHLGLGENCFDLENLLSNSDVRREHLEAVKRWLDSVRAKS